MLKRIVGKIQDFYISRIPIGGFLLLAVICGVAYVGLSMLWILIDGIPYWAYKATLIAAVAVFLHHMITKRDELGWVRQRDYMSFRVELLCADLDLIRASTVNFGIIGKIGEGNTSYAELSTGKLEVATAWRERLDAAQRPYKYVTNAGMVKVNNPAW
ncbi:hypothetical protein PQR06_20760 [Paraburkholderia graminis]